MFGKPVMIRLSAGLAILGLVGVVFWLVERAGAPANVQPASGPMFEHVELERSKAKEF